jgi:hypothetical protein
MQLSQLIPTLPLNQSMPGPDPDTCGNAPSYLEQLYARADRLIATGGLSFEDYRTLQSAESAEALRLVVARLEWQYVATSVA